MLCRHYFSRGALCCHAYAAEAAAAAAYLPDVYAFDAYAAIRAPCPRRYAAMLMPRCLFSH